MKTLILISDKQYKTIKEAVGVPTGILEAGEELYTILVNVFDNNTLESLTEDTFILTDIPLSLNINNVEILLLDLELKVEVNDTAKSDITLVGMAVSNNVMYDSQSKKMIRAIDKKMKLDIHLVLKDESIDVDDIRNYLVTEKPKFVSVLAHELKHKYDYAKKSTVTPKKLSNYSSLIGTFFNVPALDYFLHSIYFVEGSENLVRPTEVATLMIKKGVKKKDFYNFIINEESFKMLKTISTFTFDDLVGDLKNQIKNIEILLTHVNKDFSNMSDDDKVAKALEICYISLVNSRYTAYKTFIQNTQFEKILGIVTPEKQKDLNKYWDFLLKFKGREIEFFKQEINRLNKISSIMLKKISKVYSLLEENDNSIHDWTLYQTSKFTPKKPILKEYPTR